MMSLYTCILFIYAGLGSWFQRGSVFFAWQSVVNGHRVRACVGVVELPVGPGLRLQTDFFAHRLSIPELGSTHSPLIFISHLPSNTGGGEMGLGVENC